MKRKTVCGYLALPLICAALVGCGSDSESGSSAVAYVQYYNASPNSRATALVLDDYEYAAIDFADAMPRYEYNTGNTEVSILGADADADEVSLYSETLNLASDSNHLLVLLGDYLTPELLDVSYSRGEMDRLNADTDNDYSKMQLLAVNAAADAAAFDVYVAPAGADFSQAQMLGSLAYKDYTGEQMFDTGDYVAYLTEAGSTKILYTTGIMDFSNETVYKLVIRASFGAGELKITLDSVDSTSTPVNYAALEAVAEYRVYNGLADKQIDVRLASKQESQYLYDVAPGAVTDFSQTAFDDYGITVADSNSKAGLFDNLLVTFNQDESKSVLIYADADGQTRGMVIAHDWRPRAFEYKVDIANLASDYDDLKVYFVRASETIDTAAYSLGDLDFAEQASITLPADDYEINIVHKADNGTLTLVYQSSAIALDGSSNYSLVLTRDEASPLGHKLALL
ncbi:hypothetical protein LZP73_16865 [Shewanella sp. AS16]|uniref:hypothetical protein n=1 Tax=Shewanella sp. AS16 TaxID=2907625 RepID=UPI001F46FEDD|nr:hypothetical protein [Shewanella sp. AS16]MCE9687854.1 hypothetical protein [Shewanella sp. AS16]